jgi:pimeloyl-ACP methyl ester carboxylesterase
MSTRARIRTCVVHVGNDRTIALSRLRAERPGSPAVLLVPGAFCREWIWRDNFMRAMHARGFDVTAMSQSGHGVGGWSLHRRGLADLIEDLDAAIAWSPAPPNIVAHSLGGRVALELAQQRPMPPIALLAPLPLDGGWRCVSSLAGRSWTSVAKLLGVAIEPRLARLSPPLFGMFGPGVDPRRQRAVARRLQAESLRCLLEAMLPSSSQVPPRAPLHFFAGGEDAIVPADVVVRVAAAYGAPVTVYPNMGHNFQSEAQHDQVCDDIVAWFAELSADPHRTRHGPPNSGVSTSTVSARRPRDRHYRGNPALRGRDHR